MATIQADLIAKYAAEAGVKNAVALVVVVAVALAESGGNTDAHAQDSDDDSYGLWQINMIGSLGPQRRAKFGLTSNADLFDGPTNAKAMAALSNYGTNMRAWTTYTSGDYKDHIAVAQTGVQRYLKDPSAVNDKSPTENLKSAIPGYDQAADAVELADRARKWVAEPKNWIRVAMVVVGGAALLIGLNTITKPITQPVVAGAKSAGKTVGKAAAVGALL